MEIRESRNNDIVLLRPVGRLDTKTSHEFEKKVLELLGTGERRLLIDFAELDYISSAGLRVLLMAAKKLSASDGDMILSTLNQQVREVFDVAGFSGIFTIMPTQAEALGTFSRKKSTLAVHSAKISEMAARLLGVSAGKAARKAGAIDPDDSAKVRAAAAQLLGITQPAAESVSAKSEQTPAPRPAAASAPSPSAPAAPREAPAKSFRLGKWIFRR